MSKVVSVQGLSKQYEIRHETHARYSTFAETVVGLGRSFARRALHPFTMEPQVEREVFWALRDVSFEIDVGDRVGVVGRNGAGKSTLLKVLSRITEPSAGKILLRGRVASLLEVGTGFHPELTGRENVYLNGAILGMTRQDIRAKFDEIVAFAEIERFLDTPVKRYSSGMYVRLAFAVAAHLEPEILLIDEILAVGDVEFQNKCLGKMGQVSDEGRTLIFVSHNMNAVEHLCNKGLLLANGEVQKYSDDMASIIHDYLVWHGSNNSAREWVADSNHCGDDYFLLEHFALQDNDGNVLPTHWPNNQDVNVLIGGQISTLDSALQVGFAIYDEQNRLLFWSVFNDGPEEKWPELNAGTKKFSARIPRHFLNEGVYRIEVIAALYYRCWIVEPENNSPAIFLNLRGGLSESPYWSARRPGIMAPILDWSVD